MSKLKNVAAAVGVWALTMASQTNTAEAQTPTNKDSFTPVTEVVSHDVASNFLDSEGVKSDSAAMLPNTIDFFTAQEQFGWEQLENKEWWPSIEPDPGEWWEWDTGDSQSEESNVSQWSKSWVRIWYNAAIWNNTFMPGTWSVLWNRPSFSVGVNASLNSISLGISRGTDFDLNSPKTSFTQMSVSYNKKIWLSNDRNIYVGATWGYVHFDHSFNIADYGNVKLNEMMWVAQFSLKWKMFSVGLWVIYNAFLNWITPNNLVTKLEAWVDFNWTSLTGEWRLSLNEEWQKSLSAAIWVKQQLPKWFSIYLRTLAELNDLDTGFKPQVIFSVSKSWLFSKK